MSGTSDQQTFQLNREELEQVQEENLNYLEGLSLPMLSGVPIHKALSYEVIQYLNQLCIAERIQRVHISVES